MKKNDEISIQKKHIIIIAIIFLIILIVSIVVSFNWNKWFANNENNVSETSNMSETSSAVPNIDIDENAGKWNGNLPKDKNENNQEEGIKIPGYPSITIPADEKNVTMALLNPEGNPCYFKFAIVLDDSGEVLYESKHVPPGDAITEVELSKALPAGEYNATIQITTLSLDGMSQLNGANVETVLIAK